MKKMIKRILCMSLATVTICSLFVGCSKGLDDQLGESGREVDTNIIASTQTTKDISTDTNVSLDSTDVVFPNGVKIMLPIKVSDFLEATGYQEKLNDGYYSILDNKKLDDIEHSEAYFYKGENVVCVIIRNPSDKTLPLRDCNITKISIGNGTSCDENITVDSLGVGSEVSADKMDLLIEGGYSFTYCGESWQKACTITNEMEYRNSGRAKKIISIVESKVVGIQLDVD